MIKRIFKIINIKFTKILKFVFFLRYLLLIFFISSAIFLLIPKLFDYNKKEEIIKKYLSTHYGIEIKQLGKISFNLSPTPNLEVKGIKYDFVSNNNLLNTSKLIIYPKLQSIYNYDNFQIKKIELFNTDGKIDTKYINTFFPKIYNIKNKIKFRNLNLKIYEDKNHIIDLKKINISNYGFKKDIIEGEIFEKAFKINLIDKFSKINFKLLDTGISANLNLDKSAPSQFKGIFKGKLLKSNFKLNFHFDDNSLKINNFIFRDKDLSFDSNGLITIYPFFNLNLNTQIKNIKADKLKEIDFEKLLKSKQILKNLNSQNYLFFESKKFRRKLLDSLNLKTKLTYGRLAVEKKIKIFHSDFYCTGNANLLDDYPIYYFNCSINSKDKKVLLKEFGVDYKEKNEKISLEVKGNLNIFRNKVNFDYIGMNDKYIASNQDLKYFKNIFEEIIFDQKFINIFDFRKVQKFILEIS